MPSPGRIIGLLSPGAMGSAVARRLTAHGHTVLTSLNARSNASKTRAHASGMQDVALEEIVQRADFVLSILPPSEALPFAQSLAPLLNVRDPPPVFADCNAVSPATMHQIAALFPPDVLVDACIIGGPPSDGPPLYDPTFYASGASGPVQQFASVMRDGGLRVSTLDGGVGDASALKMAYAGINKGLTGLTTAMILAAHAASPATSTALMRELAFSQPALLQRTTRMVPDLLPKAYRFVGEMEEIRDFVNVGVEGGTADIWEGLARLFERVAASVRDNGEDVKVLQGFVQDAKAALEEKK